MELQEQGQTGLTLRAMEALFFQKKLLTDNQEVLNCDFYRQENIFVWGQDDECRLADFLQVPYQKIPEETVSQYTWEAWLDRFFGTAHLYCGLLHCRKRFKGKGRVPGFICKIFR